MHLTKTAILNIPRIKRLNIINSISGVKPANLIGTIDQNKKTNLAIFSSIVHLGSDPALIGFILRPQGEVPRNTYDNIISNGYYTINHVHTSFVSKAHYTSAKFENDLSEFDTCHLTEEFKFDFKAPFVRESHLKIGVKYVESVPIKANGTTLVIGEIEHLFLPDEAVSDEGYVDLDLLGSAGVGGLNSYYKLNKIDQFPFARPAEVPNFDLS